MAHKKLTLKSLTSAAKELNDVVNLDVPINADGTLEGLKNEVKEVAELLIPSDEVSENTLDTIYHLTMGELGKEKKVAGTKKSESKKGETKKVDTKKIEAKKTPAKKAEPKKAEPKKAEPKKIEPRVVCAALASDVKKVEKKYDDLENNREKSNFRKEMIVGWIEKKKYTRKDIIDIHQELFPETSKNTIGTFLSDCASEKYNTLDRLIQKDEKGVLYFS